jgi:hypothetical protein
MQSPMRATLLTRRKPRPDGSFVYRRRRSVLARLHNFTLPCPAAVPKCPATATTPTSFTSISARTCMYLSEKVRSTSR